MKKSKSAKSESVAKDANKSASESFLIVAIGASAGGIAALKSFFENVPADSGAAYVVILHLSPDHDSRLAEVLQTVARIPVEQVREKVELKPNSVYVVPPNKSLSMSDGHIIVSPVQTVEERRAPVDIFFRTLAESHGGHAVAVILSGTGANGSMGIKRVKEKGGAAFVQNPREAEYADMPRNSIATELIDEVLNVHEIPGRIVDYGKNLGKIVIPVEPEDREENEQHALREIFTLLRVRTGHDFANYKRPTVLRRIERRINVRNLPDLPAYAAYLKENAEEANALLKDLLISVTNFFRDKEAFDYLEREVVPRVLHDKTAKDQVRLWVAGCATGEEAYSLAMFFAEQTEHSIDAPSVQIFATDIDEDAIQTARGAFYTLNDAADVSPERLRKFFTAEKDGFRIRRELREMILFANHNLLKDPPFSRLDLATCRNLLIYFNKTAQERVMETLHFALKPLGYLFLGTSESVDGAGDLYAPLSRELRVFQARSVQPRVAYPVLDLSPSLRFDQSPTVLKKPPQSENFSFDKITYGDLHGRILEQFAPPSIILNEQFDIVHVSPQAGRYLQISGEVTNNLFKLIKPELRIDVTTAVYQAVQNQTNVLAENLKFSADGGERVETLNVSVRPVMSEGDDRMQGFILVIFEKTDDAPADSETVFSSPEPLNRQLEEALLHSQSQYHHSIEQSEIQAEELKAANEELQAINEELRSATEELETGKEELQSVNEELVTVNQELKIKIEELSVSNSDLRNLINSTNIGTIFLDRSQRVKMFTPVAKEIFNLIAADTGRLLTDITHRLEGENLIADVEKVLSDLQPIEREVRVSGGATYLMQITPYRTSEDRINGTIITFVNITESKRQDAELRESEEKYRSLFDSIDQGFCVIEVLFDENNKPIDYRFLDINPSFEQQTGIRNALGRRIREIAPQHEEIWFETYGRIAQTGEPMRFQNRADQLGRFYDVYAFRVGKPEECKVAILFNDITESTQRETALRESEERLSLIMKSVKDYAIITTDLDGIVNGWNPGAEKIFGYTENEIIGKSDDIFFTPEDLQKGAAEKEMRKVLETGSAEDERWHVRQDGSRFYASGVMQPLKDSEIKGFVKIARDMTERIKAEQTTLDKKMLQKLVGAQEDERQRIARDLHDELGQLLTGLRLHLEAARKLCETDEELCSKVDEAQTLAKRIDNGVDFLAWELRPAALDHFGLVAALAKYVREWSHFSGVTAELLDSGIKKTRFDSAVETNLYRIAQEALNNVHKHAGAKRVEVLLDRRGGDSLVLIIEDDGRGFKVEDKLNRGTGIGLIGMRERAALVGGSLEIESAPGNGTTVYVRVPLLGEEGEMGR